MPPLNRMIDWDESLLKPGPNDRVFAHYDIALDQQRSFKYSVFKNLFVKTDEADIKTAQLTFATNVPLRFGNAEESRISFSGTNTVMNIDSGDYVFSNSGTEAYRFRKGTGNLAMKDVRLSYTGNNNIGIGFLANDNFLILSLTDMRAPLKTEKSISYTGGTGNGLIFDINDRGEFRDGLKVTGTLESTGSLEMGGNIKMGANYISNTGGNAGLSFDGGNNAVFSGAISGASVSTNSTIESTAGSIKAFLNAEIGNYIIIDDSPPAPSIAGKAVIGYNTATGDLEVRVDGTAYKFDLTAI